MSEAFSTTAGTSPRLVHLAEYGQPRAGSFIPMLSASFAAAKARGWRVEAVFPDDVEDAPWVERLADAGVRLHFCPVRGRRARANWLRRELGGDPGPTVLHTHFTGWDLPAVVAARSWGATAVIWHLHTTLGPSLLARLRNMAKFAVLGRGVSMFLCPAENIAADARRRLARGDRVHFVPSAVYAEDLPLLDAEFRRDARAALEVPEDATVLLHFGWHWHLKGGDIFLEVVKDLASREVPRLLGLERGADVSIAAPEIERLGLGEVVRVVPMVPDIRTLFGAADVLVTSSRSEGMAYAVLESLCCGTPVVATDIPGHAYIGRQVDACRITAGDPQAIADGVVAMLDRGPERASIEAQEARDWIVANLGVEANAERLMTMYGEALEGLTR